MLSKKKRLGQYFTPIEVGTFLAKLARAESADSIVDPMAGKADLLSACLNAGAVPTRLVGIDIDPEATRQAESWREPLTMRVGDAFDLATWRGLPKFWDLVITNPPYVRYQVGGKAVEGIPGAESIRNSLIASLEARGALDDPFLTDIHQAAMKYSGLADLAVPSWLLCMALTRVGGTLAMVVPTTWLSRQYAQPVRHLMDRWFDMSVVVEDVDAAWFHDALVRTVLLVATRRASGDSKSGTPPTVIRMKRRAFLPSSSNNAECAPFDVEMLRNAIELGDEYSHPEVEIVRGRDWFVPERTSTGDRSRVVWGLPEQIRSRVDAGMTVTLGELGWQVGQGLRTGANDFFYVTRQGGAVRSRVLGDDDLLLPDSVLFPALVRQAELPDQPVICAEDAVREVLLLNEYVLPEDLSRGVGLRIMNGDLARLVRAAAKWKGPEQTKSTPLPRWSAVAPNADRRREDGRPCFWYQLPRLKRRHQPNIVLPRVIGGEPRFRMVRNRELVIDANFSTMWSTDDAILSPEGLLAFFTGSSWSRAWLEGTATRMGGGALKVEAIDIATMRLPVELLERARELNEIGARWIARPTLAGASEALSSLLPD